MTNLERVYEFLDPISPPDLRDLIVRAGDILAKAAIKSPVIAKAMRGIHAQIPGPMVKGKQLALYERMRGIGANLYMPDVHEPVKLLLAVLYLKAKMAMQRSKGEISPNDLAKKLGKAHGRPEILNQEFLGELLVETSIRAARDPAFARQLEDAVAEIRTAIPVFEQQMQSTGNAVTDEGVCIICREDPETGEVICGEGKKWVCWIIIIIVIIIIIL
ncbi:MAG TPA: hypothetical protein VI382_04835 [Candidatus Manganitrophaceae bacterium]|nr:hypothetical protein [Candidatus Manganitrophaceae bacterium]